MNAKIDVFVRKSGKMFSLWTKSEVCGENPMGGRFVMGGKPPSKGFEFYSQSDALEAAKEWNEYLHERRQQAMANTRKTKYGKN